MVEVINISYRSSNIISDLVTVYLSQSLVTIFISLNLEIDVFECNKVRNAHVS